MKRMILTAAAAGLALSASAAHAEKWDMPMAYAATNFHSEMGVVFADKVRDYTGGKIDITVHPGGSLFKGGEIKRAVQTGQAPIGERFMSAHANEAPLLGWDNLPFLATTYEANNKLWAAAKDKVNAQLDSLNLVALYTCPWPRPGLLLQEACQLVGRYPGREIPVLQRRHRDLRQGAWHDTGADRGGRTFAGAGHRRSRGLHLLRFDRL